MIKNTIAKKVIFLIILCSSVVTVVTTGLQFYFDYKSNLKVLDRELKDIESSFSIPLSSALWFIDQNQAKKQLDGISKLPHIAFVILDSQDMGEIKIINEHSRFYTNKVIKLELNNRFLGELKIGMTQDLVVNSLWNKLLLIFISNALKTFVVAMFALVVFDRYITEPLKKISDESSRLTLEQRNLTKRKQFQRKDEDELDMVSNAIQEMQDNFYDSYKKLQNAESRFKDIASLNLAALFETNELYRFKLAYCGESDNRLNNYIFISGNLFDLPLSFDQKNLLNENDEIKNLIINIDDQTYILTLRPFFDDEQSIFNGYRGTMTNITEKLLIEKKLENQNTQLHQMQKIESIGLMTAGISHDLNNLLSIMKTSLQILRRPNLKTEIQEKCINNALDAVNNSASMLRKLMDFSRKQELQFSVISLSEEVEELSGILRLSVPENMHLTFDLNSKEKCLIDKNQFESMLLNLVINARDAMPNGGNIRLTTEDSSFNGDKIYPDGEYVKLEIIDSGTGISPDIIHKIYEPFFTTKELGKGTGLGLSMVMNFVKQSEGHVFVDSTPNVGTTFRFLFPRASKA